MSKKRTTPSLLQFSQIFFFGVVVGVLFSQIPYRDSAFSPVRFEQASWKEPSTCFDSFPLPITMPIIEHKGYTVAYDGKNRTARWVYRRLAKSQTEKKANRSQCNFQEDPLIPEQIRATLRDYKGSGFDRGHLSPALDNASSQEQLQESFYLSNIVPQLPDFNRGYWKRLENYLRSLAEEADVHIFTGPLYRAKKKNSKAYVKYQVIGKNEVAVPTHFFTVIFLEKTSSHFQVQGYILPNQAISSETPLRKFTASLEEIERASGIVFSTIYRENICCSANLLSQVQNVV